jgi:glycolate oxidase iron-sulfur subunit
METHLASWLQGTADGIEAESILRKCVHCGFCTATCPTYQLLGDELDGPRGRIYLIKQVVEGVEPTRATQVHLDRCLTCRNCETTCPSGVEYGRLVDIGRKLVDAKVERPMAEKLTRSALKSLLTTRAVFEPAMKLGKAVRPLMPAALQRKIPVRKINRVRVELNVQATRSVILLNGCVQPAMMPQIDQATVRVLAGLGVESVFAPRSGCCGAIKQHMNDHEGALIDARANIDAWWPLIEAGAEAVVLNASGCGAMIKEYGHLLRHDSQYALKAKRISELALDLIEYLPRLHDLVEQALTQDPSRRVRAQGKLAFHPPCTLQHGQQIKGAVEKLLSACGAHIVSVQDAHLCCGSAGTYSVLQHEIATQLRDRKLSHLQYNAPEQILSANIGCLTHLQSGTGIPVRHWIEWLDDVLG